MEEKWKCFKKVPSPPTCFQELGRTRSATRTLTTEKDNTSNDPSSISPVLSYAAKAKLGRSNIQDPSSVPNKKGLLSQALKRSATSTFPKQTIKRQNFVPTDVILHKGKKVTYKPTDGNSKEQNEDNKLEKDILDVCKVCGKEGKSLLRH